jgi:hypothetical protein
LREAGLGWWVVFSLSGYSLLAIFMVASFYLIAIFRSISRSQREEAEHPLTRSKEYLLYYCCSPVLGVGAAFIGLEIGGSALNILVRICIGTFLAAFLSWIIFDPLAGLAEMQLGQSKACRHERLSMARERKRREHRRDADMLTEIAERELAMQRGRAKVLEPIARELVALMGKYCGADHGVEARAVKIGADAWRMGGHGCMVQLHDMAVGVYLERLWELGLGRDCVIVDHVAIWWDGIGGWQKPELCERQLCHFSVKE